jgi:hypothetical protein
VLRLIFVLGFEFAKYEIIKAVIKEFIARGLDKKYAKEIEEWEKYKREQKFAKKLDKQMRDEIERFQKTIKKWKPKELEKFVIEGLDCLEK